MQKLQARPEMVVVKSRIVLSSREVDKAELYTYATLR